MDNTITITGCTNCPLCRANDMGPGFKCKAMPNDNYIREGFKYQPLTPDWCPVKNKPLTIKYPGK